MPKVIKILSIDGGGIRGIIPGTLLAELEEQCGKPVAEIFDFVAGTSTGGILALGLTKPNDGNGKTPAFTARQLVKIYTEQGHRIFSRSVYQKFRAGGNLLDEKYPASGIESVLQEYFGTTKLSQALKEVLVTSYDIEERSPYFFKRYKALNKPDKHDYPMQTVARATSAAPTYFEPLKVYTADRTETKALIDGGVFANNPTMCAIVEAKMLYPDAQDFLVVSLGTGELTTRLAYEKVKDWGLIQWAQPILNVTFDGVSDTIDCQARRLLPPTQAGMRRYYRFQVTLSDRGDHMDDASEDNIKNLRFIAKQMIKDKYDDFLDLCKHLKELQQLEA